MVVEYDVVVLGTGNAALCAAISASDSGLSVLIIEKATKNKRGGNSYFTDGAIRFAFAKKSDFLDIVNINDELEEIELESYTSEIFYRDIMRVTENQSNHELALHLTKNSGETISWMKDNGIEFELNENQYFEKEGKKVFWGGLPLKVKGKGIGLVNGLFNVVERKKNTKILYETTVLDISINRTNQKKITYLTKDQGKSEIIAKAIILACGGFEASKEKRVKYLGDEWADAKVRGTEHNTGDGIDLAQKLGAALNGSYETCHAHTTDYNAPMYGDFNKPGDIYKKSSYPLGLIVNDDGKRFVDEGADFRNYTYAAYGKETLKQKNQRAFQLFDNKVRNLLRKEYDLEEATVYVSDSIEDLADKMGIDRDNFIKTISEYNQSVKEGDYNPSIKDGKRTKNIDPPKSNWALKFDTPPYYSYPVTCGITFTFGGLKVNSRAEVLNSEGNPIGGLYAAGEIVGGLFHKNYPGGSGLISGAVFGRTAGISAGEYINDTI